MPALMRRRGARMRGSLTMVAALGLALASTSLAGTVTCHISHDESLQRLLTTCSGGSRAVTRYGEELQRWNMQISPASGTARETQKDRTPGRDTPGRQGK
jgi:hypothetical protein